MIRRLFIFLILISYFVYGQVCVAQNVSVETIIDTHQISLGDQIYLRYKIIKQKDLKLKYPVFTDTIIKGIEIIEQPVIDSTKLDNDNLLVALNLLITSFDTGLYYIPPQPIIINSPKLKDTLFTKASYLEVLGVAIDTTGTVRDIKPVQNAPVTFRETVPFILAFIVLGLIVFAVVYFLQKKKGKDGVLKPAKIVEPPHITAFRELDKIKAQKLWQQKKEKEYYSGITYVVRWYISKRFGFHALEKTSDEVLMHIKTFKLDSINYSILDNLLNLADLVKFAKGEPDPNENIVHLDNAYDFIRQTKLELTENTSGTIVEDKIN